MVTSYIREGIRGGFLVGCILFVILTFYFGVIGPLTHIGKPFCTNFHEPLPCEVKKLPEYILIGLLIFGLPALGLAVICGPVVAFIFRNRAVFYSELIAIAFWLLIISIGNVSPRIGQFLFGRDFTVLDTAPVLFLLLIMGIVAGMSVQRIRATHESKQP